MAVYISGGILYVRKEEESVIVKCPIFHSGFDILNLGNVWGFFFFPTSIFNDVLPGVWLKLADHFWKFIFKFIPVGGYYWRDAFYYKNVSLWSVLNNVSVFCLAIISKWLYSWLHCGLCTSTVIHAVWSRSFLHISFFHHLKILLV